MKILHILPPVNLGPIDPELHTNGLVKSVWLLDKYLTRQGHDSYVAWSRNSTVCGHLVPIIDNLYSEKIWEPKDGLFQDYYKKISQLVNSSHFDIIHNHMSKPIFYKRYHPTVLTLRLALALGQKFIGPAIPYFVYTVALTNRQALDYKHNNFHIDQVIPNGVELEEFSAGFKKRKHLLSMGRVTPQKGQDIAIEVAKKTNLPLMIAGDIWDRNYFEKKIKPNLGESIRYLGPSDSKTKLDLYQSAIALLSTVTSNEAFGLTMLEAMACGTPVIGLQNGPAAEIVADGQTGFLCETAEEMARATTKLQFINSRECRAYVEKNFSIENIVSQYEELYKRVMAEENAITAADILDK